METKSRQQRTLLNELFINSQEFDFFQAIRLLIMSRKQLDRAVSFVSKDELYGIKFTAANKTTFPTSAIDSINVVEKEGNDFLVNISVAFFGLTGVTGVLPDHFTELVIERNYLNDFTLNNFLDIFNHRTISLFYKAWEKSHFFVGYEKVKSNKSSFSQKDHFSYMLDCFCGNGFDALQEDKSVVDDVLPYYAGMFSQQFRSAVGLKMILQSFFKLKIKVKQFQPERLYLSKDECTRLNISSNNEDCCNQLGISALLGSSVWSVDNKFLIKLGPLNYSEFKDFLPTCRKLALLCRLVKLYVGDQFDFEVNLILQKEEIPACYLGKSSDIQLGFNSWLKTKPFAQDSSSTVLTHKILETLPH